jgi:hypothetical protein
LQREHEQIKYSKSLPPFPPFSLPQVARSISYEEIKERIKERARTPEIQAKGVGPGLSKWDC